MLFWNDINRAKERTNARERKKTSRQIVKYIARVNYFTRINAVLFGFTAGK